MSSTAARPRPRRAWAVAALVGLILVAGPAAPAVAGGGRALDDRLLDLQLIPLDGPAPPFSLERLDNGTKVTLAEHRGRVVLLYFWATW
jgi:cytochrome oxidase Cu insertion factor (SCO1/SenC/PrrC family)